MFPLIKHSPEIKTRYSCFSGWSARKPPQPALLGETWINFKGKARRGRRRDGRVEEASKMEYFIMVNENKYSLASNFQWQTRTQDARILVLTFFSFCALKKLTNLPPRL